MHCPYLVRILFGMPSLHLFTFLMFFKSCIITTGSLKSRENGNPGMPIFTGCVYFHDTGMLGGAWERGYISLARLPQQLHEQHALLSLLSWAYSACVLFALLFRQRGALSRSILRFSAFKLLRCLRSPSRVTSRTRLYHIDDPRSFTSRTSVSTTP